MLPKSNERYPLPSLVMDDIFSANKLILLLLLAISITAFATVWITHQTRALVSEKGDLILQQQALENEYLNLKLEETAQGNNTRIEAIARRLGMHPVQNDQEVIIVE